MKFLLVLLTTGLLAFTAQAEDDQQVAEKLTALTHAQLGTDVQIQFGLTDQGFCGATGEHYLVGLSIKKYEKDATTNELKEKWVLVKIYGVSKADLATADKLTDLDTCPDAAAQTPFSESFSL